LGRVVSVDSFEQVRDALWHGQFVDSDGTTKIFSPQKDALIYKDDLPKDHDIGRCVTDDGESADLTTTKVPSSIPFNPDSELIIVRSVTPCLLVINSRVSKLWKGYVNSTKTKLFRVNEISSGVFLPPGNSTVLIKYDDQPQLILLIISAFAQFLSFIFLTSALLLRKR
jgi:hypothetical protein